MHTQKFDFSLIWKNQNPCGPDHVYLGDYCPENFPQKDGYDPSTQKAMGILLLITVGVIVQACVTWYKIFKRSRGRQSCLKNAFYIAALFTLGAELAYCFTAFESGILDTQCFTMTVQTIPAWGFSLTSVIYLGN